MNKEQEEMIKKEVKSQLEDLNSILDEQLEDIVIYVLPESRDDDDLYEEALIKAREVFFRG